MLFNKIIEVCSHSELSLYIVAYFWREKTVFTLTYEMKRLIAELITIYSIGTAYRAGIGYIKNSLSKPVPEKPRPLSFSI